jgi:hypothetical protein
MAVGRLNDLDLELKQNHFPFCHFPFLISHFSLLTPQQLFFETNDQWKMENDLILYPARM